MEKDLQVGAVIDIETTGLSPSRHEVIEVSILKFTFNKQSGDITSIVDEYHTLNQPSSPLPAMIKNLTGITNEMLAGKKMNIGNLISYCADVEYFIAHNASFDRSFMIKIVPELVERKWYCSMRSIRWKDYGFINKKLQTLLDGHQIKNEFAHRASSDTRCTLELLQQVNPLGNTYFKEMLLKKPMKAPKVSVEKPIYTTSSSRGKYM